jgi:cell division protein FtsI/penicillin-binding protein 2
MLQEYMKSYAGIARECTVLFFLIFFVMLFGILRLYIVNVMCSVSGSFGFLVICN